MEPKKANKMMYLVIGAVLVLIAVVALWYISATNQPTSQPTSQVDNSIKSVSDLNSVENSLNLANIDSLGSGLNRNDTDASQF